VIDFRYHLISIIAVLLALSLGIVTGSGFLGEPLLRGIRAQAQRVAEQNRELGRRADSSEAALLALEPEIVEGALLGQQILVVRFGGSDDAAMQNVEATISDAGGSLAITIVLNEQLALADETQVAELTSILGRPASSPDELRATFADSLGRGLAAVASKGQPGRSENLRRLLDGLAGSGYLSVDGVAGQPVPLGARFVIVGGGQGSPPFPVNDVVVALASRLAARDGSVLVAESASSTWGLASAVREDALSRASVWTVDNTDQVLGRIAFALALQRSSQRPAGHYGTDPDASAIVPEPPTG
jgi:Copper transport outer membrane protein, MctB